MPTKDEIASYRAALGAELKALDLGDRQGAEDQDTVALDQQSVGRLSRMDALQRQAMAQATARRRGARRTRIQAALARLNDGEFGYCQDCGDEIPPQRLHLDATSPSCLSCAKG